MTRYLALLRGVNVGGKGLVGMVPLKTMLEQAGFGDVRTYIQSGNVFFDSTDLDQLALTGHISQLILEHFGVAANVIVFTKDQWQGIITGAPQSWGKDQSQKHNLLILLPPYNMDEVTKAIGELKPEMEMMTPGDGVLYQSMSLKLLGRTTTSKLASSPIYKRITVRNYNTATRLLELF